MILKLTYLSRAPIRRLNAEGTSYLSKSVLAHLRNLTHLDLSCNNIGDPGAISLGNSLSNLINLEVLRIGRNRIGGEGGQKVASALGSLAAMREINLEGPHTICICAEASRNPPSAFTE